MSEQEYRNWRLDDDLDGVCWLTIDRAGESANSLSREVLTELEQIVTTLEKERPRGLVLQSGKKGSFIVGADVRELPIDIVLTRLRAQPTDRWRDDPANCGH